MAYTSKLLPVVLIASSCAILWTAYQLSKAAVNTTMAKATKITFTQFTLPNSSFTARGEMLRRKEKVSQMCKTLSDPLSNITHFSKRYLTYRPENLLYCYVAKAGCTFWKRVFLTLQYANGHNPSWTSYLRKAHKSSIHRLKIDNLEAMPLDIAQDYLSSARKFVFVRDPYSRLFSAYVDKFVLGDFWDSYGKTIITEFRQNPSTFSKECGHDVTFEEFLKFVVLTSASPLAGGGREHWSPVSELCHPCSVHFDLIGKQESFSKDRDFILDELKLHDLLSPLEDLSLEDSAVSSMAQSAILLWDRTARAPLACQTYALQLHSLLQGFEYQGYLSENSTFGWTAEKETLQVFLKMIRTLFVKQTLNVEEFHKRRKQAKISAYKNVHLSLLHKVKEIFETDFLLFDYDPLPNEIFTDR